METSGSTSGLRSRVWDCLRRAGDSTKWALSGKRIVVELRYCQYESIEWTNARGVHAKESICLIILTFRKLPTEQHIGFLDIRSHPSNSSQSSLRSSILCLECHRTQPCFRCRPGPIFDVNIDGSSHSRLNTCAEPSAFSAPLSPEAKYGVILG
jgi:hypothetical protein